MARITPLAIASVASLALSACAGSGRFDGFPGLGGPSRPVQQAPEPEPAPMAIPRTGPVTSEPLPPPTYPGQPAAVPGAAPGTVIGSPSGPSDLPPTIPGAPPPTAGLPPPAGSPAIPPVASASPPPSPAPPSASSSLASVGTWTARDATGRTCRVVLSSAATLDLNRASASGCANTDLQRINAWKQDGGEIYLYSAGSVVARLRGGGGSLSGALSKSGAPLTLSK